MSKYNDFLDLRLKIENLLYDIHGELDHDFTFYELVERDLINAYDKIEEVLKFLKRANNGINPYDPFHEEDVAYYD